MTEEITLTHDEAVALAEAEVAHIHKKRLRADIKAEAGDPLSLLGTTADATQLLLYHVAMLVSHLHTATTLAEVREAAAPFATLASPFLARVESGEVRLPYQTKGLEVVMGDIERRASAVAEALANHTPTTPSDTTGD